jgi:PAS domain S-box-containing protein
VASRGAVLFQQRLFGHFMTQLFRKQLAIAIFPVLLLAAISTVWTTRLSERHMIEQLKESLAIESELQAEGISAFLSERIAELKTIAASPVCQSGSDATTLAYLKSEQARLPDHFEYLYLNDLAGKAQSSAGHTINIADRGYFPRVQRGELVITTLDKSRDTEQPILLILVPLRDAGGKLQGAISGTILLSTLEDRLAKVVPADQGFAALVDAEHKLLAPRGEQNDARRKAFSEWLQEQHPDLEDGATSHGTYQAALDGENYFLSHLNIDNTDWQFFVAKRASLAAEPAVVLRWSNLLFSGIVLVIAFLIAYYSTGRLLGPLAELVEVHRRFGQGDYQARILDLPNDELGELGHAINRTAHQLSERQAAQKVAERQLRDSEARLRLISDNVDDAILLHDAEGRLIDVNHSACESLGYSLDELLQKKVFDIVKAPPEAELRQIWRTLIQRQEKVRRVEATHRRRDGNEFPVEMSAVPLQTAQGVRILVSARDISERRRAENKMANFFRLSEDMMCIADSQGIFRQMSPAFEQVLGFRLEEMLGRPYLDFVHPDDREHTRIEGRKVFEGHGNVNFENRYRCKDGSYKWLQWRPFRETYEGMIYAIARDVTESHRTTRLMAQTSAAARIGGWELDYLTGELFWTDETYRLHETTPQEFTPTLESAIAFYTPESRRLIQAAVEKGRADGTPWSLELELITAKGRHIWSHALGRVDIENGKPLRAYGSFQDITERKAAEAERRQLDDQLREMQRIESIGILAGGIAHDFNNLLTGVLGFTRLAQAEARENDTIRGHLQQIEQCSLRAADLCKQLLAYAGKGQFVIETIDLSQLVRETSGLVESIMGSNARLEFELDPKLPYIEGDPTQLRQVVMNLVTNAFDALGQNQGVIRVRTGLRHFSQATLNAARLNAGIAAGDYVFLEVTDTGTGMSEETLARIFDPFFTTKFAGRGLGLAAVQGIVRSHHGAILVTSTLGKGTTFTMLMPPSEEDGDVEREEVEAHHPLPATSRASSGGTVLVVDDEAAVLTLARTALERGGFRVLTAASGPDALQQYESHRPEIVAALVDITMPGMNGMEVLRQLRAKNEDLALLMMSGYSENSLEAASEELKLAGFVEKPFRLGDVVVAVQQALDRGT